MYSSPLTGASNRELRRNRCRIYHQNAMLTRFVLPVAAYNRYLQAGPEMLMLLKKGAFS
jgi:hypothetical protein